MASLSFSLVVGTTKIQWLIIESAYHPYRICSQLRNLLLIASLNLITRRQITILDWDEDDCLSFHDVNYLSKSDATKSGSSTGVEWHLLRFECHFVLFRIIDFVVYFDKGCLKHYSVRS